MWNLTKPGSGRARGAAVASPVWAALLLAAPVRAQAKLEASMAVDLQVDGNAKFSFEMRFPSQGR